MKVMGKDFTLTENAIDYGEIEYTPLMGTIVPMFIDNIEGLREKLNYCGYIKRDMKPEMIYIFILDADDDYKGIFCIKYPKPIEFNGWGEFYFIHNPRFEFDRQEVACFVPELFTAWEHFEPYNIA